MRKEDLDRIRDMIDDLRSLRQGADQPLYRHYSGAISSLRAVLRAYGRDYEPA